MAVNKKILIPLPSYGYDLTEVTIPWKLMAARGFQIVFITPDGNKALPDQLMLDGRKLGIWKPLLQARKDAVDAFVEMDKCPAFCFPTKYTEVDVADFDGLHLPGGHDKRIRPYLESEILQQLVVSFFSAKKPVAAICHGVVLAARSVNPETGKSVLYDYQTTALLKSQELTAYNLTRLWLKDYYLTYPEITVEDEVKSVLATPGDFHQGPSPLLRDDEKHLKRGFCVQDRNYLSARWPGDAYSYSYNFIKMIERTN